MFLTVSTVFTIFTQALYGVDLINKPNLGFIEGILWIAKNVGLAVASQSDPFGKSLYLLGIIRSRLKEAV